MIVNLRFLSFLVNLSEGVRDDPKTTVRLVSGTLARGEVTLPRGEVMCVTGRWNLVSTARLLLETSALDPHGEPSGADVSRSLNCEACEDSRHFFHEELTEP